MLIHFNRKILIHYDFIDWVHPLWLYFRLRQAAMQSANIDSCQSGAESDSKSKREVLDSKKSESPRFENFQQFKEYKQKMRDQGLENESIIVSIPNTTGQYHDPTPNLIQIQPSHRQYLIMKCLKWIQEPLKKINLHIQSIKMFLLILQFFKLNFQAINDKFLNPLPLPLKLLPLKIFKGMIIKICTF